MKYKKTIIFFIFTFIIGYIFGALTSHEAEILIFFKNLVLLGIFLIIVGCVFIQIFIIDKEKRERRILKLIIKQKEIICPIDIASKTNFSLAEAKNFLESLSNQGLSSQKINADGTLSYLFGKA